MREKGKTEMRGDEIVRVNAGAGYEVITASGLLEQAGELIRRVKEPCRVMVVSDSNVAPLYLPRIKASLTAAGFEVYTHIFKAGEASKTPENYLDIINRMAAAELTRDDAALALGGGVAGDITGFAAATYMRGISFIQAPTTLLAMIDSALGGKTGVDLEGGKNLLGAFWQPSLVICDTDTLNTLPEKEMKNGMGEGVKYAVLAGGSIFDAVYNGIDARNATGFIRGCQLKKAEIVEADEREGGLRRLLNLGHTLAHAEEKLSGYGIPHGEAVAKGVRIMAEAAYGAGELEGVEYGKICSIAHAYGFDGAYGYSYEQVRECLKLDKKIDSKGYLSVVKILGIGSCAVEKMSLDEFGKYVGGAL